MAVFKGSGEVFYQPETDVNCIWEYYQQDVSRDVLSRFLNADVL